MAVVGCSERRLNQHGAAHGQRNGLRLSAQLESLGKNANDVFFMAGCRDASRENRILLILRAIF